MRSGIRDYWTRENQQHGFLWICIQTPFCNQNLVNVLISMRSETPLPLLTLHPISSWSLHAVVRYVDGNLVDGFTWKQLDMGHICRTLRKTNNIIYILTTSATTKGCSESIRMMMMIVRRPTNTPQFSFFSARTKSKKKNKKKSNLRTTHSCSRRTVSSRNPHTECANVRPYFPLSLNWKYDSDLLWNTVLLKNGARNRNT